MVMVLVVGGVSGWMAHVMRTQRAAVAAVTAAGGYVNYDWSRPDRGTNAGPVALARVRPTGPAAPAWARRWLGDELFQTVLGAGFDQPVTPGAIAALRHFEHLDTLNLAQKEPIAVDLTDLRHNRRLATLILRAPATTDAVLGQVAGLDSLRELYIQWTRPVLKSPATDAGFAGLARLPNLEALVIDDSPLLTDAGAARLVEGLPRLRSFSIRGGPTSAALLLPSLVRHHPDLEGLTLNRSELRPEDARPLAGLTQLIGLELQSTKIGDAGLAALGPLRLLKNLMINNTEITGAGLPHLAGLTRLETLHLDMNPIGDGDLPALAPLANLRRLYLYGTRITDAGLPQLARLPRLEEVRLTGLPITDGGVLALAKLSQLRSLDVSRTQVTPEGLAALKQALPDLKPTAIRILPPASPPSPASTTR